MKKNLLAIVISSLMLSAIGCGQAFAVDTSDDLLILGEITPSAPTCAVMLDKSSVSILEKSDTLIKQGENATLPTTVHISVEGDPRCSEMIDAGKIGYKILGTPDNADGTALSNLLSDETAAKGVAIGIYDSQNKPFAVNSDTMMAKTDSSFGLQMVQLTGQQAVEGNINSLATVQIERL